MASRSLEAFGLRNYLRLELRQLDGCVEEFAAALCFHAVDFDGGFQRGSALDLDGQAACILFAVAMGQYGPVKWR